jgi:putative aldouronate transport system permease protein
MKLSLGDRAFNAVNYTLIIVFTILVLYPFLWCIIISFNEGRDTQLGGIYLWPRAFTFENYRFVFSNPSIIVAARNSVARTLLGTVLAVAVTSMFAYTISKSDLVFRKAYMVLGLVTMYFNGGLIPYVLVIRGVGLYNNFLVYILPNLFTMFNAIIFLAYFRTIPSSLEESAKMDGANEFTIFVRILAPVAKPVFATIALFNGVAQWNSWFDTMLFARSEQLETLSHIMTKMITAQRFIDEVMAERSLGVGTTSVNMTTTSLMMATMVVTAFPIIVTYPFLQKYFAKGILIGSLKG